MFIFVLLFLSIPTYVLAQSSPQKSSAFINESVFVQSPTDTDQDGKPDRIYVQVSRVKSKKKQPTIFTISPYALGGNNVQFHNVDMDLLPQDESFYAHEPVAKTLQSFLKKKKFSVGTKMALERGYARVKAHSLGTGHSTGCPTVGDDAETQAAKAVIDWLNGRAKAYNSSGKEVIASWATGSVGMTGVSYNGTLPNMVATTGVDGLNAIIPVASISSWYNYYRANGLVVGPGGYIGEDADILGKYVVRRGACGNQIKDITRSMGREHGDYTDFWRDRDYLTKAESVKAAVFIMHGQSDWNVRQRHAVEWWNALAGVVPRRMWLHKGGHSHPSRPDLNEQIWAWFDRYVKGVNNNVEDQPAVEVQSPDGKWREQKEWPNEETVEKKFFLNVGSDLSEVPSKEKSLSFIDGGKTLKFSQLIKNPLQVNAARLAWVTDKLKSSVLMSGTPKMSLNFSILNRRAANISVAVVEYTSSNTGRIVTRGWADPQNHNGLEEGDFLAQGQDYTLDFDLEPKQHSFKAGSRIGVIVTATDYEHTLRPAKGTKVRVNLGESSFVKLRLSGF